MIDIANKLFPNILTILTQLAATGIIFILYRKYVHHPVMHWLDHQAEKLTEAQHYADKVEQAAVLREKELEAEFNHKMEVFHQAQQAVQDDYKKRQAEMLASAKAESENIYNETYEKLYHENQQMQKELEAHVVDLAVELSKRALENYHYEEEALIASLEKEMALIHDEEN